MASSAQTFEEYFNSMKKELDAEGILMILFIENIFLVLLMYNTWVCVCICVHAYVYAFLLSIEHNLEIHVNIEGFVFFFE